MKPIKFTFGIAVASLLAFAAQAAPQYGLQNFNNWAQDLENTGTIQVNNNTQAVCTVDYTGGNDATNRPRAELAIHNLVPNGGVGGWGFTLDIPGVFSGAGSGQGGSSFYGGGGLSVGQGLNGNAGTLYGSGGSGGASNPGGIAYTGGAGAKGIVIITEYI